MHINLTLPGTDMSLYLSDSYDSDVATAYTMAYEDHEQQFQYSNDRELYNPHNIEDTPVDWFCIFKINDQPVQCSIMSHYDWMPDDWFRMLSRMHNMYSYTKHEKWFTYRMIEWDLMRQAQTVLERKNFIITQNISKDGKLNYSNYRKVARRGLRLFKKCTDFPGYVYPSICYLNKTPQYVLYSSYCNTKPDASWLEEFAVHED